ncbi:MAG: metallophosphoesterase [Candidatus Marinimicrobia bacterium]|nr:metallophosphoesterase [Candidatus Neomarinimicrobiota bacterium]
MSGRLTNKFHMKFTIDFLKKIRVFSIIYVLVFLILQNGCARKGFVSESVPPHLYDFKRELPASTHKRNPVFLVYGDHRPSWSVAEGFLDKRNWSKIRLLLFPFYLPGLLFNTTFGGTAYLRRLPDVGSKMRKRVLNQIYQEVSNGGIDFIAHTGDIVENGTYHTQWEDFLIEAGVEKPVMKLVPYYPAPGNHERPNEAVYGKYNYDTVFPNSRFYTKKFKDVVLIFLDSGILFDQNRDFPSFTVQDSLYRKYLVSEPDSKKASWLEEQLTSAQEKQKIILIHHPLFSYGKHSRNWDKTWGLNLIQKRKEITQLFQKHKVQLIIAGHEHYYEHNVLKYVSEGKNYNMHVLVTGGGGTPIRPLVSLSKVNKWLDEDMQEGYEVEMVNRAEEYHYCIISVTENGINIEVVKVDDGEIENRIILDEFLIR